MNLSEKNKNLNKTHMYLFPACAYLSICGNIKNRLLAFVDQLMGENENKMNWTNTSLIFLKLGFFWKSMAGSN